MSALEVLNSSGMHVLAGEAFGVRVALTTNDEAVRTRLSELLPPGWRDCSPIAVEHRLSVTTTDGASFDVRLDEKDVSGGSDLELALALLDAQLRGVIALHSPDRVFVHAGVVAQGDRALVLPGSSFAGKTTLVAALVRAGAVYFSDEFAVLDEEGLVHPYPKPLSLRDGGVLQTDHSVEALGGVAGDHALPVDAIVATSYAPDAGWSPERVSAGAGALALIGHAVAAQEQPERVLRAARRAAEGALVLEGERGDADEVAPLLLAELER